MNVKKSLKVGAGMLVLALLLACFIVPMNEASARTLSSNETGTHGGYDFEYWKDTGNGTMTLKDGGAFSCQWSNINNILFRKGRKFDQTKTYQQLGNITVEYGADYRPSGNSYLCVYGWTVDPLVEYYIVESWGSWRPPGASSKGTITVDGGTYDVYETTRVQQPSIKGTATFQQYWSVRTSKKTSGTISVSQHFAAWERMGMKMGKMYEVALTVEGYQSSGSADVYKNNISVGGTPPQSGGSPGNSSGEGSSSNPAPSTNPSAPNSRSAFTTIQAEQYNKMSSSTIEVIGTGNNGNGLGYIERGNSVTYSGVDFGNGASSFTARVASGADSSTSIEISANGTRIGTLTVPATGGWDNYRELSTTISNVTGVSDLVLTFSGPVNIDSFVFVRSSGSSQQPGQPQQPQQPQQPGQSGGEKNAFNGISADKFDEASASNITVIDTDSGSGIGYIESGNTVTYKNVNFGNGATSFTAKVATEMSSVNIEIIVNGSRVGTLTVPSTGGWNNYRELSANISNVSGVRDLVLRFSGPVNVGTFAFGTGGTSQQPGQPQQPQQPGQPQQPQQPGGSGNLSVSVSENTWGNGATVNVTVKNNGSTAVNGWEVNLGFSGDVRVTSSWNANFNTSGSGVTASNIGWNGSIPPGGSVSFGFNISYSGSYSKPTASAKAR